VASAARPGGFIHTPFIHSGPLTRSVEDAALMLSVMAGPHPRDPFSLPDQGIDYLAATRRSIRGLRIGYSPRLDVFPVDRRVSAVIDDAVKAFEQVGASVEPVTLGLRRPQQEYAAVWLRQVGVVYAGMHQGFTRMGIDLLGDLRGDIPRQFADVIEQGLRLSAVEFKQDDVIRSEVFDAFQDAFERYDILVSPTLAVPPVDNATDGNTLGPSEINGETVDPLIGWCLTYPMNFTGHPAASIPAGLTDDGLPIGLQIMGRRFADDTVLAASAAFERVRPWVQTYRR
jgi:Asp-tRNA(Asn)/Glu-tRNA(Gln) amidotransferase A subunit family amidase